MGHIKSIGSVNKQDEKPYAVSLLESIIHTLCGCISSQVWKIYEESLRKILNKLSTDEDRLTKDESKGKLL